MYFACQFKENLSDDIESRELLFESPKKALRQQLKNYLSPNNDLNGDEIMRDCFPMINDVRFFISHSHKDEALAIKLANLIFSSCRMKSFIDSMVWDYSQELLRDIDDEYSVLREDPKVYNYNKVGLSASYVHMMLATSLTAMMDKCDCIIFINTPNSITPSEIKESPKTFSPWIFHELSMIQFLKEKRPDFTYENYSMNKVASREQSSLKIKLPTQINDLPYIKRAHLSELKQFISQQNKCLDQVKRIITMKKLKELIYKQ